MGNPIYVWVTRSKNGTALVPTSGVCDWNLYKQKYTHLNEYTTAVFHYCNSIWTNNVYGCML